jgi:predicted DNA-binding protein YlxM (UPF0122 family)
VLFDLYGAVLTELQRRACGFVLEEDASLAEIAEEMGTTRQAVHDLIVRSRRRLEALESRLGLAERERSAEARLVAVGRLLDRRGSELSVSLQGEIRSLIGGNAVPEEENVDV